MIGEDREALRKLLRQLVVWCEDATEMVGGLSPNGFRTDKKAQYATSKCIEGIGETARRIVQDHPDFVAGHPDLPFPEVYRMRNRLAHGYDVVSFDVVWETATRDAPALAMRIRAILEAFADDPEP